jgi:hypothetical protein
MSPQAMHQKTDRSSVMCGRLSFQLTTKLLLTNTDVRSTKSLSITEKHGGELYVGLSTVFARSIENIKTLSAMSLEATHKLIKRPNGHEA